MRPGGMLSGRREVDAPVRRSHDEEDARRIFQQGLAFCGFFGIRKEELALLKKGDAASWRSRVPFGST